VLNDKQTLKLNNGLQYPLLADEDKAVIEAFEFGT
jgi:peroxiredoxin